MSKKEQHQEAINMIHKLYAKREITEGEYTAMLNVHRAKLKEIYLEEAKAAQG